jgi:hypothetical protein
VAGLGVKRVITDLSGLAAVSSTAKKRTITLKAVKAGAKLVQAAAKAKAPRRKADGGGLQQAIGIKPVKGTRGRTLAYCVVGPRVKVEKQVRQGRKTYKYVPARTAHIVEGVAKPHDLRRGKGGGVVRHPGAKPRPWLAPGWKEQKARAAAVTAEVLAAETQKAIEKAAVKVPRGK